jgi:hypothetical protein
MACTKYYIGTVLHMELITAWFTWRKREVERELCTIPEYI